jgi:hypothetical protein
VSDEPQVAVRLDDTVLDRLAELICGDDTLAYRSGYQLTRFFEAAGWRRVGEVDGGRLMWVRRTLRSRRNDSDALRAVLLRLADPREYLDEADARVTVVRELNELLALEGYEVVYQGSRPHLVTRTGTLARPEMREPVRLTADLAEIVKDEKFGQQLTRRLEEAHLCWGSGAYTAAVIMLGSVLEGVLCDVARSRHVGGPEPKDHLYGLIGLAERKGWIAKDVTDYAHVLRDHRNLVHPKKQLVDNYALKDDTVRIAWNVVVAALNDLGVEPGTT